MLWKDMCFWLRCCSCSLCVVLFTLSVSEASSTWTWTVLWKGRRAPSLLPLMPTPFYVAFLHFFSIVCFTATAYFHSVLLHFYSMLFFLFLPQSRKRWASACSTSAGVPGLREGTPRCSLGARVAQLPGLGFKFLSDRQACA